MSREVRTILGVGGVLLLMHLAAMELLRKPDGRVVFGDATHHFVQLRSMVFDRDLHFQNDYTRIYNLKGGEPGTEWVTTEHTATGYVRNYMPVGPALLWLPLYVLLAAGQLVLSWVGLAVRPDGFDRVLQMVPGVMGVVAATAASWISWRTLRRFVDDTTALIAVLGVWLGSHALYYSLVSPAYSHAASMFATSLFIWRWSTTRDHPTVRRIAVWGALAGVAALMRWQDALLLALPLFEAVRWRASYRARATAMAGAIAGFLVAFAPQMAVWHTLYGQPFAIPQGGSFMRWTTPHPILVLLSDNHGLFTWTPLVVLTLIGLVGFLRHQAAWRVPAMFVLAAAWYTNAAVADWWAGEAFGSRRFLSLFPLFVIGLGWWLRPRTGARWALDWRHALVGALVAANWLLLLQYQLFMKGLTDIAPYPSFWFNLFGARFAVPLRLLDWLVG